LGRGTKLGPLFNVIEQAGKVISAPVLERPTNENLCRILAILSEEFGIRERKKRNWAKIPSLRFLAAQDSQTFP
jgi:hypothetical protein